MAFLLAALTFFFRMPSAFLRHELNPDESLMLIQGVKFLIDPVPWRSVDGFSSGPLNSWGISALLALGIKPGYVFLHLLASSLVAALVGLTWLTLARLAPRSHAAIGVTPMILFMGFASDDNFLHYSSELIPVLLFALAIHFLVEEELGTSRYPSLAVFASGLAIGCSVWAKSQAFPIAGALTLLITASLIRKRENWIRHCAALTAGILLPAAAILIVVGTAGVTDDFWNSYLRGNLAYAGTGGLAATVGHVLPALTQREIFAFSVLLIFALALCASRLSLSRNQVWLAGLFAAYFSACLFAVCRPVATFPHYMTLLVHPMTLLGVLLTSGSIVNPVRVVTASRIAEQQLVSRARFPILGIVALILFVPQITRYIRYTGNVFDRHMPPATDANYKIASAISDLLRTERSRKVSIWGWMPGAYVLSRSVPATRDAICGMVITRGPMQSYYRQRFLHDLRQNMPDLFVDSVVKGAFLWHPNFDRPSPNDWTEQDGYESDPALKTLIDANYVLVRELPLAPGGHPVRFFARLAHRAYQSL
jgi:hypothetical protein